MALEAKLFDMEVAFEPAQAFLRWAVLLEGHVRLRRLSCGGLATTCFATCFATTGLANTGFILGRGATATPLAATLLLHTAAAMAPRDRRDNAQRRFCIAERPARRPQWRSEEGGREHRLEPAIGPGEGPDKPLEGKWLLDPNGYGTKRHTNTQTHFCDG